MTSLSGSLDYWQTHTNLSSPFSHFNQLLVAVQNPSNQKREEVVEIQVPYYNYTVHQVVNGSLVEVSNFDKFLPRTWLNSNRTIVKSYLKLTVDFSDPQQIEKVFLIKNLGVLRQNNAPPSNFTGNPNKIWNLNLPIFLQKNGWEIDVFQSNFKRGIKPGSVISAGTKSLKFLL